MGLFRNYLPALAFAVLFRDDAALAEKPYAVVRADVERLLDEAATASKNAPPEARQEALFAVCAFVDEAILTSAWPGRREWARATLQRLHFNTVNAGVEFYEHCRALLQREPGLAGPGVSGPDATGRAAQPAPRANAATPLSFSEYPLQKEGRAGGKATPEPETDAAPAPDALISTVFRPAEARERPSGAEPWREEVLGLYGACLSMGFTGRYHDAAERETLRQVALASLERAAAGRVPLCQRTLSPEAYYMPETPAPRQKRWLTYALALAGPVLATALLYAVYDHVLGAYLAQWLPTLPEALR